MAENQNTKIIIDGDSRGAVAAFNQISAASSAVTGQITGMLGGVNAAFLGITGLVAGGMFKSIISETTSWIGEVGKLSRNMGITAEQASVLKVALHGLGIDTDTASAAALRLAKSINSDGGAAIENLGVKVKDSNGNLRNSIDIMADVNSVLAQMKAGTDRNAAGLSVYGRSWGEVQQMLRLTREEMTEAARSAEKLHLVFSSDNTAQVREYKKAMNELKLVGESIAIQTGSQILPPLLGLGHFLNNYGPAGAAIFGESLRSLTRTMAESGVVAGATMDKITAWVDTGGLLGHMFSNKKNSEWQTRIGNIDSAAGSQMAEIYNTLYGDKRFSKAPDGNTFDPSKAAGAKPATKTASGFFGKAWDQNAADLMTESMEPIMGPLGTMQGSDVAFLGSGLNMNKTAPYSILGPGGAEAWIQQAQTDRETKSNFLLEDAALENEITVALFQRKEEERQLDLESARAYEQSKKQMEVNTFNNTVGLLQVLGSKNKAAAIAAIALQKAQSIAATYISGVAGAQLAYGSQLIVGDPTSLARAEAARMYTLGLMWANIGMIAATGLIQASTVGGSSSGGSGNGSYASPIITQPTTNQAAQGNVVFNIQGPIIGEDKWVEENLIPLISAAASRNVTIQYN